MNICLVQLKLKDSFKTGYFASKWLIKVEVLSDSMFILKMCRSFAEFEKNIAFEV